MKWVNPPVAWMLHAGVPRLIAAGVHIPVLNDGDLARVALEGGAEATRDAMLRIGYFGPTTAPHHQDLIQSMFDTAMTPLRQDTPFDFGRSDLLERLRNMGLAIGNDRELAHVPPAATLFLHRKIGGMYLMAAKLRAKIALRPMVEGYCDMDIAPR